MHDNIINVGDWIRRWAQIQPDKTAIISEDVPYSYADLNRRVNKLSHFFLHIGVKKGDSPSSAVTDFRISNYI
jgi:acyl-CoA synthetase (AMP-forming)/AMP-acid ligase II